MIKKEREKKLIKRNKKHKEPENILCERIVSYVCDPDKNKMCSKSSCYKNGGLCRCTTVKAFSRNGKIDCIIDKGMFK